MQLAKIQNFAFTHLLLGLLIIGPIYPAHALSENHTQEFAQKYSSLKDWREIAEVDQELQKLFLQNLESRGYKGRITRIALRTPFGNALPSLGGTAQPLSGLVVTHSMDGNKGRRNNVSEYLSHGYNSIGVDKSGNVFIRGTSFVRTKEGYVPNLSSINLTFDVNAEEGEQVNAAQISTAAEIAEALQKAFTTLGTKVQVQFKDHHDKGFKPGKNFLEAGPAKNAANLRLKSMNQP